ncbi:unnamed protein product [Closterium sp. NIES-53]
MLASQLTVLVSLSFLPHSPTSPSPALNNPLKEFLPTSELTVLLPRNSLNNTLKQFLPTSKLTVFVPRNSAFDKLTGSFQYSKLKKNKVALLQVMAFHVLEQRFYDSTLEALKVGTQFATLDYKFVMVKSGTKPARFAKLGATGGLQIVQPDLYVDPQVIVHGVDTVIIPPKIL